MTEPATPLSLLTRLVEALAANGVQPVVTDSPLADLVEMPAVANPRTRLWLSFSAEEFDRAIEELDVGASSLWPDRPTRLRALQLMLVHIDEDLATRTHDAAETVMTLHPDGQARISPRRSKGT